LERPTFVALSGLTIACLAAGVPLSLLTRDPVEVLNAPAYYGAVSSIGILIWSASAAVCFFGAAVVWRTSRNPEGTSFLAATGLLTAWLVLDDVLMLHDVILPGVLGFRQRYVLVAYVVIVSLYLFRFRRVIFKSEYPILFFALSFFGLSVLSDTVQTRMNFAWHHHLEDGCKLMGIVGWTVFSARMAFQRVFLTLEAAKPRQNQGKIEETPTPPLAVTERVLEMASSRGR